MRILLLAIVSVVGVSQGFAQIDSFDVFTYRSPEFYTKSVSEEAIRFALIAGDSNFCTITLYRSVDAKKDVMKDVASQWKEQVVKRLTRADKKPAKIMTGKTWDGWKSIVAIGNFYRNNKKCVVMLQSFAKDRTSGFVIFAFSDPLFKSAVEDFSKNLHLHSN